MINREQFIAEIPLREGAYAIYIERPHILYVRVSEIRCLEDGMEAQITMVHIPGMNEVGTPPSFKISAAWQGLSNIHSVWHVPFVSWTVYFGDEELRIGLELAARASEARSLLFGKCGPRWKSSNSRCTSQLCHSSPIPVRSSHSPFTRSARICDERKQGVTNRQIRTSKRSEPLIIRPAPFVELRSSIYV